MGKGRRGSTRAVLAKQAGQQAQRQAPLAVEDGLIVLVQRGITPRQRHLVRDLGTLLPRVAFGEKLPRRATLEAVQDACFLTEGGMRALFLPAHFEDNMWMWLVRLPHGPSVRFQAINLHTIAELNFEHELRRVRHPCLVSFDRAFDAEPHLRLIREMLRAAFSAAAPTGAAASPTEPEPPAALAARGFRTVMSFSYADARVWLRAYDVVPDEVNCESDALRERGPRLVLTPQRVLSAVLDGAVLWSGPD
jgi:ribosome biogenesis protein BRX1